MTDKKTEILTLATCRKFLKARPKNAHKGLFGHVLIIGGDYGMAGAALLAGEAALRIGAGRVTVATRPEHALNIFIAVPELMTLPLHAPENLEPLIHQATVILIGPGLGQKEWGLQLFRYLIGLELLELNDIPLVIDADALNILSSIANVKTRDNWILTPHPGEAGRLLGCTTESIQRDRLQSVLALQKQYQGTVILKGAGSLVKGKKGSVKLCQLGNPGMASPGMGDVLSGFVAGLVAQGLEPLEASALAVVVHALAGDLAEEFQGERGILASDLLGYIPQCLNS